MNLSQIEITHFINSLSDPIIILNNDGNIAIVNYAFTDLFPYSPENNTSLFELFNDQTELINRVNNVIQSGSKYILRSIQLKTNINEKSLFDIQAFPIKDKKNNNQFIGLYFHHKNHSDLLGETQNREERLSYLTTISSGLTHEIRNPLSGIKGASQLLASELENKTELQKYAKIIEKEVNRVDELLKNLQHFTKPSSLNKSEININKILHHLVTLQKTIDPENIKFIEEYDPSLPKIQGDSDALHQVFLNLIKNAYESIDQQGWVKIKSRIHADLVMIKKNEKRRMIRIEIIDNGKGFNHEIKKEIFTPFFTTKAEGTGLGLPLCHQIIRDHDGSIQVNSKINQGTNFTIYLPI